ncbi:hypothetical protein ALC60_08259, partial [Trachymyrmex zeteki]
LRCRNMEEGNKYRLDKEFRSYYVNECQKVCSWFRDLGEDREEIWRKLWSKELDSEKSKVLEKLKREKRLGKRELMRRELLR